MRGVNIDSDHYLVVPKVRNRLTSEKKSVAENLPSKSYKPHRLPKLLKIQFLHFWQKIPLHLSQYNVGYREASAAKDATHTDTLQSVATRAVLERHRDLKFQDKRLHKGEEKGHKEST